jgi:hypothetical protein
LKTRPSHRPKNEFACFCGRNYNFDFIEEYNKKIKPVHHFDDLSMGIFGSQLIFGQNYYFSVFFVSLALSVHFGVPFKAVANTKRKIDKN